MSNWVARDRIVKLAQKHRHDLISRYKDIPYFSATSDIWTRSNHSFIAVSVHYFPKPDKEELATDFIACELFEGAHTNDRIAQKLSSILDRYGILDKVHFITTDGDSKYVASFKYHGDNYQSMSELLREDSEWVGDCNATSMYCNDTDAMDMELDREEAMEEDEEEDSDSELASHVLYHRIDEDNDNSGVDEDEDDENARTQALDQNTEDVFNVRTFPPAPATPTDESTDEDEESIHEFIRVMRQINRIACSSHALDKVGSKDSKTARNDRPYKRKFDAVMKKLKLLWKMKKRRQKAETFKKETGKKLIGPHRIRWLSKYDAVILTINIAKF